MDKICEDITPRPWVWWLLCGAHSTVKHLPPAPHGEERPKAISLCQNEKKKNAALCATVRFVTALTGHLLPRWVSVWPWSITFAATPISSPPWDWNNWGLEVKEEKVLGRKSQYPYLYVHKQVLQVQSWNAGRDLRDQWGDAWRSCWFCNERQEGFRNYLPSSPCPGSIQQLPATRDGVHTTVCKTLLEPWGAGIALPQTQKNICYIRESFPFLLTALMPQLPLLPKKSVYPNPSDPSPTESPIHSQGQWGGCRDGATELPQPLFTTNSTPGNKLISLIFYRFNQEKKNLCPIPNSSSVWKEIVAFWKCELWRRGTKQCCASPRCLVRDPPF